MAIANYFYNATIRKYVALFGTYFNQLMIERDDNASNTVQKMIVPIAYAPWQKVLNRITQDPTLTQKSAITLPRMSFEITSMTYDGERKISPTIKIRKTGSEAGNKFVYAGVPYNIEFSLYVMAKYNEDAVKIVEQILPFFNPDFTSTVRLVEGLDPVDIPLVLNSVVSEDIYEGSYDERRSIIYTLNFTMKAWFFGPEKQKSVIKFVEVHTATDTAANTPFSTAYTVQPGLTANGEPTTDITETINYTLIEFDDNWAYIKTKTDL